MNVHRRVFLALALTLASVTGASAADDLTGIWSAQTRSKGGLGFQWVFSDNGKVALTFGALVDFKYMTNADTITLTPATGAPATGEVMTEPFAIDGNRMMQIQPPGVETHLERRGPSYPGAHPIVGDWTYPHPSGPTALARYSREGVFQLSVPFKTLEGTYRITGNLLEVELPERGPMTFEVKRDGRTLVLTERGGNNKVTMYTKFEY
jgi:hypothetical protein